MQGHIQHLPAGAHNIWTCKGTSAKLHGLAKAHIFKNSMDLQRHIYKLLGLANPHLQNSLGLQNYVEVLQTSRDHY